MQQVVADRLYRYSQATRDDYKRQEQASYNDTSISWPGQHTTHSSPVPDVEVVLFCRQTHAGASAKDVRSNYRARLYVPLRLADARPSQIVVVEGLIAQHKAWQAVNRTSDREHHPVGVRLSSADVEGIKLALSAYQLDLKSVQNAYMSAWGDQHDTAYLTVSCTK